jgi:ATP-dependent helicase/DNAse subunit B
VHNATDVRIRNVVGAFYMPIEVSPKKAKLGKHSDRNDSFDYKARGIFNGDFYRQLDRSDSNKFYNFFVTKKGDQYGRDSTSGALRPGIFEKVLRFTERRIVQLAQEIVSGKIDVIPYRLGGVSPCSYCKYKPVCRFDWQINNYNFLESLNKSQVFERAEVVDG